MIAIRSASPLTAAVLMALLALGPQRARASTVCIDSNGAFPTAFQFANAAPEGSTIDLRVVAGSYSIGTDLVFDAAGNNDNKFVSFTGGWDAGCSTQTIDADNTVLAFNGHKLDFDADMQSFLMQGLTIQGHSFVEVTDPVCATLDICATPGPAIIRYNHFRAGGQVQFGTFDGLKYTVTGNLFEHLSASISAVDVFSESGGPPPEFAFNTIADISCGNPGFATSAVAFASATGPALIHDNIIQSSSCDVSLNFDNGSGIVDLRNNLYASILGDPVIASGNVVSTLPRFVGSGNYRLLESGTPSPAINAGSTFVGLGQIGTSDPFQDLDGPGGGRLVGLHFDMGAYESSVVDTGPLIVNNTNDDGAGSLRVAIASANATPGAQVIRFNLNGSCPRTIQLATPLPDIVDSVFIDGYSQPGSAPNTRLIGSDAQLCVAVTGGLAGLSHALQVPQAAPAATTLVVSGLAFSGGFTTAIALRGGSGHALRGSAVGGIGPGNIGLLGSNTTDVVIRGTAQKVTIGGNDVADRNSFGGSVLNSIVLNDESSAGHSIIGNYFGLTPDGNDVQPIGSSAISAQASAGVKIRANVIAAYAASAIDVSGPTASGYQIRDNRIGASAYGLTPSKFGGGNGVEISGGSGNHEVLLNTIVNQQQAGIWLTGSAGNGTQIRYNSIAFNGTSGLGLGIDLGALGPTPDDALDADSGPNGLQNAPVVSASFALAGGARRLRGRLASTPGKALMVDVYRSGFCPGGNRGADARTPVISQTVYTNGAGVGYFNADIPGQYGPAYLSATATDQDSGDTSEIGPCFTESESIFSDGLD